MIFDSENMKKPTKLAQFGLYIWCHDLQQTYQYWSLNHANYTFHYFYSSWNTGGA